MKKLKTLFVQFENTFDKWQVASFRGAVIEKVGRESLLFHNHKTDTELSYLYPLIQYKSIYKKPSLFCLGDGVDEIHKLFHQKNWEINLHGEIYQLKIDRLDLNHVTLNVWDKLFNYTITNWLALNAENYSRFKQLNSAEEKTALLQKMMIGNIISLAKGVEWDVDKTIELTINEIEEERKLHYKGVTLAGFNLKFTSNVYLPNFIGLGKSVSHGFGVVKMNKKV